MSAAMSSVEASGDRVVVTLRIPYADTDKMEHVYYANYLKYFEIARNEWMRVRGLTYRSFEESGYGVPVAEAHVRYRGRVFYDDLIEVDASAKQVRKTRLQFDYTVTRKGEDKVLAEGYTLHAVVDMTSGKAVRVPETLSSLLMKS